jgi:transcriptional regulator with XRE-family HTH domain
MADNGRLALALVRKRRGWTQKDVAKRLKLDKSAVSKLETGTRRLDMRTLDFFLPGYDLTPRQWCRMVDILEEAGEQAARYPTAQQTLLPFSELREPATERHTGERPGRPNEPEIDAAARDLMDDIRILLRAVYKGEFLAGE